MDKDGIAAAYDDVRNDLSDTNWAFIAYDDGQNIVLDSIGVEYNELLTKFEDDQRAFAFVRVYTGDEMSRRAKFVLITWLGPGLSPLKRAKVSTDKSLVKEVIQNIAKDIQTCERSELDFEAVRQEVIKAGGANYGTGDA